MINILIYDKKIMNSRHNNVNTLHKIMSSRYDSVNTLIYEKKIISLKHNREK